jgi:RimJ/RimL family protein N-acetyltransferase
MEALALEYAFSVLGLHKLCCEVLEFNKPVLGLHKKFGFEEEGFFKEQRLIGANLVGVYRLAIASAHWKEIRSDFISAFDPKASL